MLPAVIINIATNQSEMPRKMIICSPGLLLLGGLNSGKSAELWIPDSQGCPYVQHMLFLLQFLYTQLFFSKNIFKNIFLKIKSWIAILLWVLFRDVAFALSLTCLVPWQPTLWMWVIRAGLEMVKMIMVIAM